MAQRAVAPAWAAVGSVLAAAAAPESAEVLESVQLLSAPELVRQSAQRYQSNRRTSRHC